MPGNEGPCCLDISSLPELALLTYEKRLAEALRGFLTELCLTNAGVVMAYINSGQDSNIDDLIASSAELFLKPGRIFYARQAIIESDWGAPPHVSIALRFRQPSMTAAFHVVFDDSSIGVHIDAIEFNKPLGTESENLHRFEAALAAARIAGH